MQIGGVDKKVTAMMERKRCREERMTKREDAEKRRKAETEDTISSEEHQEESNPDDECIGDIWKSDDDNEQNIIDKNFMPFPTVALEADRYGVSNRAAAAICTAALIDYGVVTSDDRQNIVDHHKVWRARQKGWKNLHEISMDEEEISAVFFDGQKDITLVKEKIGDIWYGKKVSEDHYHCHTQDG